MDLQARVLAKKRNRLIARDWQEAERAKKTAGYIMCIQGILARGTKGQVTLLRHAQQHYVLIVT